MCNHHKKDSYATWTQANKVADNDERAGRLGDRRNTLTVYQCKGCNLFLVTQSKRRGRRGYNRVIEKQGVERHLAQVLGG